MACSHGIESDIPCPRCAASAAAAATAQRGCLAVHPSLGKCELTVGHGAAHQSPRGKWFEAGGSISHHPIPPPSEVTLAEALNQALGETRASLAIAGAAFRAATVRYQGELDEAEQRLRQRLQVIVLQFNGTVDFEPDPPPPEVPTEDPPVGGSEPPPTERP